MSHDSVHCVQKPAVNKNSLHASVLSHNMCSVFSMDVNLWLYVGGENDVMTSRWRSSKCSVEVFLALVKKWLNIIMVHED